MSTAGVIALPKLPRFGALPSLLPVLLLFRAEEMAVLLLNREDAEAFTLTTPSFAWQSQLPNVQI